MEIVRLILSVVSFIGFLIFWVLFVKLKRTFLSNCDQMQGIEEIKQEIVNLKSVMSADISEKIKILSETMFSLQKSSNDQIMMSMNSNNTTMIQSVSANNQNLVDSLFKNNESFLNYLTDLKGSVSRSITELKDDMRASMSEIKLSVDKNLTDVRNDNNKQLEQMRVVVDEKLQSTLTDRLNSSFNVISERLEAVAKGLGEMNNLAVNVIDLKKVLTNVKTRGTWGEVSLENLLDNILTTDQYEKQFNLTGKQNQEKVDFAIKMPGKKDNEKVYLPIDVKFPIEDYQRMLTALETADTIAYAESVRKLKDEVKTQARSIRDKYIKPPTTTNFAIMYLPIEGLYAEILRIDGLVEYLQNDLKVIPVGPTNITALLNSLQLGFRTLAIEKSSQEVFKILATFNKDIEKYVALLSRAKSYIDKAGTEIDDASKKTSEIQRKLSKVERLSDSIAIEE